MLNNVTNAVNRAVRLVVLRHPNAMTCSVWRKTLSRIEIDPSTGLQSVTADGVATIGGMGVLRKEDESQFDYVELGEARVLFGSYQPSDYVERADGVIPQAQHEAQIACVADAGLPEHFTAATGDLVSVFPGLGTVICFEIASASSGTSIAPYVTRFVLNPRDDLSSLAPFAPGASDPPPGL